MTYRARSAVPPLVARATELATRLDCSISCTPEVGRLLRLLVASVPSGSIGEIGTGAGVGAAWLASGMGPDASLVTIERDARRADAARDLFAAVPRVTVLHGDWHDLLLRGPFALLFVDVGEAKGIDPELVVQVLAPGGVAVLDDLTPEALWPDDWRGRVDAVRAFWLNDSRLAATELLVTSREAVILATRMR